MKHTKIKRVISLFVCLCSVLSLFGVTSAYADGPADADSITAYGIDVSVWQGNIDWEKVKADGIDFAILRAGYTGGKDTYFEDNYVKAKAAGIDLGCYFYTYAVNVDEAKKDADLLMSWLEGKKFEYPIYYDMEEDSKQLAEGMTTELRTEMCLAFMDKMKENGWYTGLYTNQNWLINYLDEEALAKKHDIWLASWTGSGRPTIDHSEKYGLWQYSATGKVNGISGNVDMDVSFREYPTIIKKGGYNGYAKINSIKVDEEWIITEDNVNVRENPGTVFAKLGKLSKNKRIHVTEKYDDGTYTWGKFKSGNLEGWCALNYAEKTTSTLISNNDKIKIKNKMILGLKPGEEVYDNLFKVSGLAKIKTVQTKLGFGTGTKINLVLGETVVNTYYVVIVGDINGDCFADSFDLVYSFAITNFEMEYEPGTAEFLASDLNSDGVCDVYDSNLLAEVVNFE